jgi:two-component system sensor histidine kinase TctE
MLMHGLSQTLPDRRLTNITSSCRCRHVHSFDRRLYSLQAVMLRSLSDAGRRVDATSHLGARGLEQPVWVMAHRALVEGVLNNLLDNALRYGRPQVGAPQVTVSLEQSHPHVLLSVQDNGPGISADQRQRVMQRWSQGQAGEALKEGAGLGLAIVSEYARLMGATLSLQPGDGGVGLTLTLQFAQVASGEGEA